MVYAIYAREIAMHQVRARRAARNDPRYAGQKHDNATWTRRLAAKIAREQAIRMRAGAAKRRGK